MFFYKEGFSSSDYTSKCLTTKKPDNNLIQKSVPEDLSTCIEKNYDDKNLYKKKNTKKTYTFTRHIKKVFKNISKSHCKCNMLNFKKKYIINKL